MYTFSQFHSLELVPVLRNSNCGLKNRNSNEASRLCDGSIGPLKNYIRNGFRIAGLGLTECRCPPDSRRCSLKSFVLGPSSKTVNPSLDKIKIVTGSLFSENGQRITSDDSSFQPLPLSATSQPIVKP